MTACSVAATALPGSTERDSTTPSIGERIEAFDRLVSSFDSAALASSTLAFALVSLSPEMTLFGFFVVYGLSGYVLAAVGLIKRRAA